MQVPVEDPTVDPASFRQSPASLEPPSEGGFRRPDGPWARAQGVEAVVGAWRADPRVWSNVVLDRRLPPTEGRYCPIPDALHPKVAAALRARGLQRLYVHQAEAFRLAGAGRDLVVATPTASGKSLAFNLPVLDALARAPEARALYLFPTKALSRDQEVGLRRLLSDAALEHGATTFDGDTPADARRSARERCGVLITNPDMLHASVLPHHAQWARLFANLKFVVVDEVHAYRGVFGSHLANVIRRLLRAAEFHGAKPQLLFSSATIANPEAHASRLAGRPVHAVTESGAPTGGRRVLFYNPPIVNAELGIRRSCLKEAVRLATGLVKADVPTIVFGQSRNQVEVMLKYLRDAAADTVDLTSMQAYRGGYLANTRRTIERGLREGSIRCVVATHALELGIDIGGLEAVVCAGFPGTMAGLWQRFGRAGRRNGESLAVLVASSAPLDQYLAGVPQAMIDAPVEHARIDPDNVEILIQHLKCAAFELPFAEGEGFGDVPREEVQDALQFLAEHRVLQAVEGRQGRRVFHWSAEAFPAHHVPLRSVTWDNFVIIDVERERTLAEMDFRSTHTMLHEQAIYQHDGRQYQVEYLDYKNHKAFIRAVKPDYYTTALTTTRVSVLLEAESAAMLTESASNDSAGPLSAGHGEVNVVEKVVGYKKIKFHTHENVGYGDVDLPAIEKPTTAFWIVVPERLLSNMPAPRSVVMDTLRGWLTALHAVAAVGLMVDPRDLGQAVVDEPGVLVSLPGDASPRRFEPTLYLYDSVAGGIGLAERLFLDRHQVIERAFDLIARCECSDGCPSCMGPGRRAGDPAVPSEAYRGSRPEPGHALLYGHRQEVNRRKLALELGQRAGLWAPRG